MIYIGNLFFTAKVIVNYHDYIDDQKIKETELCRNMYIISEKEYDLLLKELKKQTKGSLVIFKGELIDRKMTNKFSELSKELTGRRGVAQKIIRDRIIRTFQEDYPCYLAHISKDDYPERVTFYKDYLSQ